MWCELMVTMDVPPKAGCWFFHVFVDFKDLSIKDPGVIHSLASLLSVSIFLCEMLPTCFLMELSLFLPWKNSFRPNTL